ncbi:MAG TPA: holo-ACP synthase [Candidatus Cloacimonadota bacterium]|mgnify:CR=1 FL=1|nr:holo-ACP synthase [Candidatus Cloacimonadota bacterium]HPS38999.1 holo-ACP synthase [Candidatus Cloacimonadota bacterium]
MIYGIGTDIIEISRIKRSLDINDRFAEKIFTPGEIKYCESRTSKYQSYAVRFAAKESVMKALGTGWDGNINWKDIEVVNDAGGKPKIVTHGQTSALLTERNLTHIHISLTHEKAYAIAYCVIESA